MDKRILIFFFILCLVGNYCIAQPKIQVIQGTTLNFGDVYNTDKLSHDVTIKNVGTDTLHIKKVTTQCGCTTTGLSDSKLGPADTGRLTITFNPANYSSKVVKHVYVESDDPTNPNLTIEFTVNVSTLFKIDPTMFSFNDAKADSIYEKSVTITNTSKQTVKLSDPQTKMDVIKVSLKKRELKPGESAELTAEFHPPKSGTYPGTIEVATDHPAFPKLEIRVYGWVTRK